MAFLGAGTSAAQDFDLTGAWTFSVMSPNGAGTRDVKFVQQGKDLTGEIASSMAAGPLKGTIEGNVVTFVAEVFMESGPFDITYRATYKDGELIDGTVDFGDYGSGTFTGRRKTEGGEG
jgi:hypothetical protein